MATKKTTDTENSTSDTSAAGTQVRVDGVLTKKTIEALQRKISVKVTGKLDQATVSGLQEMTGQPVTGYLINQERPHVTLDSYTNIEVNTYRYTGKFPGNYGDPTLRFLQGKLSAPQTGQLDQATIKAVQEWVNGGGDLI